MIDIKRCLEEPLLQGFVEALARRIKDDHPDEDDNWLLPSEAQKRMDIGKTTFYKLVNAGEIQTSQRTAKGKFTVSEKSIEAYYERHRK